MMHKLAFLLVLLLVSVSAFADEKAKSIVYFIDVSAAASPIMSAARDQIKQSISQRKADQQFNIVPLGADKKKPHSEKLVTATKEAKTASYDYIDALFPKGKSSLLPLADYLKTSDAEMCWVLLTDWTDEEAKKEHRNTGITDYDTMEGRLKDLEETTKRLKEEYKGKTKINIIFLTDDPKSPMIKPLQELTKTYKGTFKTYERSKF